MKINKQLFEDVLSCKLKGTFVLRNGTKINTSNFKKNVNGCNNIYPYRTNDYSYTAYGYAYINLVSDYDIVDFIPDTDMKENELTIEIPDGKIVDWDESKKQNKIVLKDKQLTYEDVCNRLQNMIDITLFNTPTPSKQGNVLVADVHQLECIIAKNMLANVAKYLNNGWKPSKTDFGQFICACGEELEIRDRNDYKFNNNIIFKSKELAKKTIEILGEETVKLALEPLGI
jgi:hypothetical protein